MTDEIPAPIADESLSIAAEYDLDPERVRQARVDLLAELFAATYVAGSDAPVSLRDLAAQARLAGLESNQIATAQTQAKREYVDGDGGPDA